MTGEDPDLILSVSRRTDIPAFYTDWFINRIKAGFVHVRNPMNYHQVSKVSLAPDVIDCMVFWTKNPTPILDKLKLISNYNYYFQVTINAYDKKIERNVPETNIIINTFQNLSMKIGKQKMIWRYDPIFYTSGIDLSYHLKKFSMIASQLTGFTNRCVISFADVYRKTERNMRCLQPLNEDMMLEMGAHLSAIAKSFDMEIIACSESIDLSPVGIKNAKCIDDSLISSIIGQKIYVDKDKNQRSECGCVTSVDIGAYNTCKHGCLYCYANYSDTSVKNNILKHNPHSPFLIGDKEPDDKVTVRKMQSYINTQTSFLNSV